MKFRYLIAVPFTSHGSELCLYEEETLTSATKVKIIPAVHISGIDFSLLKRGFESIPVQLLSRPAAEFNFNKEINMITYTGFPSQSILLDYYLCSEKFHSIFIKRNLYIKHLRYLIKEFSKKVVASSIHELSAFIKQFSDSLTTAIPFLMLSAVIDETVFDKALYRIDKYDEEKRAQLHNLVFKSQFTKFNANYPSNLLKKKRIHLPTNEFFLANEGENIYRELEITRTAFNEQVTSLGVGEVNLLWFCKLIYQISEELYGLWASLISFLSFMITRWASLNGYINFEQVYELSIEDMLLKSHWRTS